MRKILSGIVLSAVFSFCLSNASAAIRVVNVDNFQFVPENVFANPGDTIRWVWVDGFHTVTSGSDCIDDKTYFNHDIDDTMPANMQFDFVVPAMAPPTIPYFCIPHCPIMEGTITVVTGPIPATSTWSLIALGGLVLGAGGWMLIRNARLQQKMASP